MNIPQGTHTGALGLEAATPKGTTSQSGEPLSNTAGRRTGATVEPARLGWAPTLKHLAVAAAVIVACAAASAQQPQTIAIQGKDSSWKLVGTVEPLTPFQIGARGTVDFGGFRQNDNATAGVTGNPFGKIARDLFTGGIAEFISWIESAVSNDFAGDLSGTGIDGAASDGSDTTLSAKTGRSHYTAMHWNWVDYINQNGPTVNYDEGAFFVTMTTNGTPPVQSNTADQLVTPALYYWYKKIFEQGANVAYDKKVWVWAKLHDGGRSPYSTNSFRDNKGSYTIWIDPDAQITDTAMKATVDPMRFNFSNTDAGRKLRARAITATSGQPRHLVTVLQRKTAAHDPQ